MGIHKLCEEIKFLAHSGNPLKIQNNFKGFFYYFTFIKKKFEIQFFHTPQYEFQILPATL